MCFKETPKEIAPMCEFACLVCLYKKKTRCHHRDNKEYCEDMKQSIVKFEELVKEVLTEKMKPQTEEK